MTRTPTPLTLITGGSRGLGRSMALALAAQGHDVILTYRSAAAEAQAVVARIEALGRRALALPLEVADSASFPAFAERVDAALSAQWQRERFDSLILNAGSGGHHLLADTSEAVFDQLVAVHLKSAVFLTQALLPRLADGGRLLHISSGLTRFTVPGYGAYAAMKGALEVLTRYQAKELAPRGITVNTVAPGAVATDFGGGRVRDDAALNAQLAGVTALGRVGEPDDIGGAVAALLAPGTGWITGQRLEVSGGMFL